MLSSNGSICEAQDDYSRGSIISFKKGELLQLSTNGHEVQSLETGQKSAVPMIYIGYSRVELLQLFQFAVTDPLIQFDDNLSDDDRAYYFMKKITNNPTQVQSLRKWISKHKCKNICLHAVIVMILFLFTVFKASYSFEASNLQDLSIKKGLSTIQKYQ